MTRWLRQSCDVIQNSITHSDLGRMQSPTVQRQMLSEMGYYKSVAHAWNTRENARKKALTKAITSSLTHVESVKPSSGTSSVMCVSSKSDYNNVLCNSF